MPDDRHERVTERAHSLWENEGRPNGRAIDHWLKAEHEVGGGAESGPATHPDDVDRAAGPTHGVQDFGGHDAEAEGSAKSGLGKQNFESGDAPKQAGTDEPDVGEESGRSGHDPQ